MAEEFGDKTHEATPHRREQAREDGQVVKSQDLASAALLVAAVLILGYFGNSLAQSLGRVTQEHLGGEAWIRLDGQDLTNRILHLTWELGKSLVPILALVMVAGIVVQMGQIGFLFLPQKLALDIQRINPLSNMGRIFSVANTVHLGFGMLKIGVICVVAAWGLWGERERLMTLMDRSSPEIASYLFSVLFWICLQIGCSLLVLALFDYGFLFWKHENDLRMTTQEMREELKSQQGDPQLIARRKSVQRQLVMNRLSSTVPKADVIVTNPTELAIALQYDPEKMAAPVVIAKGAGILAQRIRRLGLESGIPIVERKELARALYQHVDINHPVPAEQYAAVAEVVKYVYQLKGKALPGARAA